MAIDNTDLRAILDAISKERKSSSIFNAGQDTGIKDLRDANDRNADAQLQILKDIVNADRSKTKELVKGVNKAFQDAGISREIKSLKDILLAQDQAKAMSHVAAELRKVKNAEYASQEEAQKKLDELNDVLEKVGMKLTDFGDAAAKVAKVEGNVFKDEQKYRIAGVKNAQELDDAAELTVDALEKSAKAHERHSEASDYAKRFIFRLGNAAKAVAKDFLKFAEQEQRFQQASATADAGWIEGITQLGISQIEYAKILKDTRIEQLAMASGGVDFKASLKASADSLESLTPDLETAGKVAASFHKNMALAGVSQENLGDAVAQQTKIYKENFRAMSITAEEFATLTTELISSQGMRNELLTLHESERKQYVLTIQRRQAEYLAMGYTIERAKELQNTFQAINKMSPKSRMQKAAQQRSMMGAMGMGAEGARAFDLQIRMRTMNAKDRADAELELTEINKKVAKKYGQLTGAGAGLGQSMVFQTMGEKTGIDAIAEKFETESALGRKIDKDQLTQLNEINSGVSEALKWLSIFSAAENSSVGSIATSMLSGGANMLASGAGLYAGGKLAGMAATKFLGKGAGEAGKTTAKSAGSAAIKGVADPALKKGLAKGAAKGLVRAIPGIGMIAALGLAGYRASEGDWLGASMELGAGAASLLPFVGTAGSLALSAGLVAHDLTRDTDSSSEEIVNPEEDSPMNSSPQKTLEELNITMKSLNEFIRSNGVVNTNQLDTIKQATAAITTNQHYLAPNSARSAQ